MSHKLNLILLAFGMSAVLITTPPLHADQVEMLNGDRLSGKVLTMTAETVVLQSEVLGRVNVPRQKVASVAFHTNTAPDTATTTSARIASPNISPGGNPPVALLPGNAAPAAPVGATAADTNIVRQIREQMLAGNPAAAAKFDALAEGFLSGQLNLNDIRREAKASADQLRELQRLDPQVAATLDGYLQVLDNFLKESADVPAASTAPSQPNSQTH